MRLIVILAALALAGCQGMGTGYNGNMSAEQIKAAVSDKSASVVCLRVIAAGVTSETLIINLDKATIQDGGLTVGGKCDSVSITTQAPPKATPVPVVSPTK